MHEEIIQQLIRNAQPFNQIASFSSQPGIYALFFIGTEIILPGFHPLTNQIIYIGKTETSQQSRDLNTHFASDKTGSSTLRRSFGALLRVKLGLIPIPRNKTDYSARRLSQFAFDSESENRLTIWMRNNLGLSFYEFNDKFSLDDLETQLIRAIQPVFNIDWKNPSNPFAKFIKAERKNTATIGFANAKLKTTSEEMQLALKVPKQQKKTPVSKNLEWDNPKNGKTYKYEAIWLLVLPQIITYVEMNVVGTKGIQLSDTAFSLVGNRKTYQFFVELVNGQVANNIDGNAVARDLARVLQNHPQSRKMLANKHLIIRLENDFLLSIAIL